MLLQLTLPFTRTLSKVEQTFCRPREIIENQLFHINYYNITHFIVKTPLLVLGRSRKPF